MASRQISTRASARRWPGLRISRGGLAMPAACLKYEIPLVLENGGGVIVNTSSGAGIKVALVADGGQTL